MKWKFKPSIVTEGYFDGFVEIEYPTREERSKLQADAYLEYESDKAESSAAEKAMLIKEKMGKEVYSRIVSVNLTYKEDPSIVVMSKEDLGDHPMTPKVMDELAEFVLNGVKLSKNL